MKIVRIHTILAVLLAMAWTSSPAEEKDAAAKLQLKLPKKRALTYVVERVVKSKSTRGDSVTTTPTRRTSPIIKSISCVWSMRRTFARSSSSG